MFIVVLTFIVFFGFSSVQAESIESFLDRKSTEARSHMTDVIGMPEWHPLVQQFGGSSSYQPLSFDEMMQLGVAIEMLNRQIAHANRLQRIEYERQIEEHEARLRSYTLDDAMNEFVATKYINKEAALKNKHPKNPKIKLVVSDDFWESYHEDRENRSHYVQKFFNKVGRKYFISDSFSEKSHWFFFAVSASNKEQELQSILVKNRHESFIETLAILYAGAKHPDLDYYFNKQRAEWLETLLKKRHLELKKSESAASSDQSNSIKLSPTDEYHLVNKIKKLIASAKNIDTACLYFKRGDRVVGPFSVSKVRDWLKSEKLSSDDYLSDSDAGPWLGVGDSPFSIYAKKKTTE